MPIRLLICEFLGSFTFDESVITQNRHIDILKDKHGVFDALILGIVLKILFKF